MTRGSDMEEGPDLSHLTPEERAIIESVMVRQKQEEEREQEIMRYFCYSIQSHVIVLYRSTALPRFFPHLLAINRFQIHE